MGIILDLFGTCLGRMWDMSGAWLKHVWEIVCTNQNDSICSLRASCHDHTGGGEGGEEEVLPDHLAKQPTPPNKCLCCGTNLYKTMTMSK